MRDNTYWANRAAERMYNYMEQAERVSADIAKAYQESMEVLNKETKIILHTFQTHHHLTEAEARLLIRHAKGKTIADKLKATLENITDEDKKAKIKAAIDAPAYQYRIGRLEVLEENIDRKCTRLYGMEQKADTTHFRSLCGEAYKRTLFDVQKGTGLGFSFSPMPASRVNEILKNPWSGEHYSSRIWGHVSEMGDQLKEEMLISFMTGRSGQKTAMAVSERFGVGASDARRLVRTESCYIANQAEMDSYRECDVDKYEFVAALDARTSEMCRNLDGKVFQLEKQRPGVNAPPMHPYCRSTTIAVFDDDVTESLRRRARNPETGKSELIPADMNYREWDAYMTAARNEPLLTEDLKSIVIDTGGKLEGLEFRRKTPESYLRKIHTDIRAGKSETAALKTTYDVVRYTNIAEADSFTENYSKTVEALKEKGYNILRVKNTLAVPNAFYRGVNTVVESADKTRFELQFHTPESFLVKQENHVLYEKQRLPSTSTEDQKRLILEMQKKTQDIETPKGVEAIQTFDNTLKGERS